MSVKKEHTPTPWQNIEWSCHAKTTIVIEDKDHPFGKTTVAEFMKEEDAAFAVEACNSHSRLVQENQELKKNLTELQTYILEMDVLRPDFIDADVQVKLLMKIIDAATSVLKMRQAKTA